MIKLKSEGNDPDAVELVAAINKGLVETEQKFEGEILGLKKSLESKSEAEKANVEKIDELKSILSEQGTAISIMKKEGARPEQKTTKEHIKGLILGNADMFKQLANNESSPKYLDIKAAAPISVENSLGGSVYLPTPSFKPGVVDLVRTKPVLLDFITTTRNAAPVIVWTEQTNPQGQAEFVSENELRNLASFEWKSNISADKTVSVLMKVSKRALTDLESFSEAVSREIDYLLNIEVDKAILEGDGLGDNIKGIAQHASGYVLTSVLTTGIPNNFDAIRAAVTQVNSLEFNASYVFLNPIDAANMDLSKALNGHYVIPPFSSLNGMSVSGLAVIQTNRIPVGSLLVADMSRANAEIVEDINIK